MPGAAAWAIVQAFRLFIGRSPNIFLVSDFRKAEILSINRVLESDIT